LSLAVLEIHVTPMSSLTFRRELITRFAALTARALNPADGGAELEDYSLYLMLSDTLAGARGPQSARYLTVLAGHALVHDRISPEQAAQTYFERVIDRPLFLARANHWHKGHQLLLALCQRGPDPRWAGATLIRSLDPPPANVLSLGAPSDFSAAAARLARGPHAISPGNPAAATRAKAGPLYLEAASARAEIPEELSLWGAISASPKRLRPLAGGDWMEFRNLAVQAFEAANAPYAALLGLGLWPADWEDELSAHAVKQLSAFLSAAREGEAGPSLSGWRRAWSDTRKVPGFKTADDLWNSPLGSRLRSQARDRTVDLEPLEQEGVSESEEQILEATTFERLLGQCRDGGCIDDLEVWLFTQLRQGADAAELRKAPAMRARLAAVGLAMDAYLDELRLRAHAFVSGLMDDPSR
jgi:hypothetical protein